MAEPSDRRICPDGGYCHHECDGPYCFRVAACGPLSGLYPDNRWPEWIVELVGTEPS